MALPTFKLWRPALCAPQRKTKNEVERGGAGERGYDAKWTRFSFGYRAKNPLCAECDRRGRVILCDVVDHIIPLRHGGKKYDRANLQPLCNSCHNGWKKLLERHAVVHGMVTSLPTWCAQPETRPGKFKWRAARPVAGTID